MATRKLSEKLTSGEILSIRKGGTGTEKEVLIKDDLGNPSSMPIFTGEGITKTVGATGDFTTLAEAFRWVEKTFPTKSEQVGPERNSTTPKVKLVLQEQTHVLTPEYVGGYYTRVAHCFCRLEVTGESSAKRATTIVDGVTNSCHMQFMFMPWVQLNDFTFDGGDQAISVERVKNLITYGSWKEGTTAVRFTSGSFYIGHVDTAGISVADDSVMTGTLYMYNTTAFFGAENYSAQLNCPALELRPRSRSHLTISSGMTIKNLQAADGAYIAMEPYNTGTPVPLVMDYLDLYDGSKASSRRYNEDLTVGRISCYNGSECNLSNVETSIVPTGTQTNSFVTAQQDSIITFARSKDLLIQPGGGGTYAVLCRENSSVFLGDQCTINMVTDSDALHAQMGGKIVASSPVTFSTSGSGSLSLTDPGKRDVSGAVVYDGETSPTADTTALDARVTQNENDLATLLPFEFDADATVTVGAAGDFTTLQDAFDYAALLRPAEVVAATYGSASWPMLTIQLIDSSLTLPSGSCRPAGLQVPVKLTGTSSLLTTLDLNTNGATLMFKDCLLVQIEDMTISGGYLRGSVNSNIRVGYLGNDVVFTNRTYVYTYAGEAYMGISSVNAPLELGTLASSEGCTIWINADLDVDQLQATYGSQITLNGGTRSTTVNNKVVTADNGCISGLELANDCPLWELDRGGKVILHSDSVTQTNIPLEWHNQADSDGCEIYTNDGSSEILLHADVTKTVGAGQDFETLQAAAEWVRRVQALTEGAMTDGWSVPYGTQITLSLAAGTHTIDKVAFEGYNGFVHIIGADASTTVITGGSLMIRDMAYVRIDEVELDCRVRLSGVTMADIGWNDLILGSSFDFDGWGSYVFIWDYTPGPYTIGGMGMGTTGFLHWSREFAPAAAAITMTRLPSTGFCKYTGHAGDSLIVDQIYTWEGGIIKCSFDTITVNEYIASIENGKIHITDTSFDTGDASVTVAGTALTWLPIDGHVAAAGNGEVSIKGTLEVTDCIAGKWCIDVEDHGTVSVTGGITYGTPLTGLGESSVPHAIIQSDGSAIYDGVTEVTLEEWQTADVTKTVGAGQDFETLQEAADWFNSKIAKGRSSDAYWYDGDQAPKITFTLSAGTHLLTSTHSDDAIRFERYSGPLVIEGGGSGVTTISTGKLLFRNLHYMEFDKLTCQATIDCWDIAEGYFGFTDLVMASAGDIEFTTTRSYVYLYLADGSSLNKIWSSRSLVSVGVQETNASVSIGRANATDSAYLDILAWDTGQTLTIGEITASYNAYVWVDAYAQDFTMAPVGSDDCYISAYMNSFITIRDAFTMTPQLPSYQPACIEADGNSQVQMLDASITDPGTADDYGFMAVDGSKIIHEVITWTPHGSTPIQQYYSAVGEHTTDGSFIGDKLVSPYFPHVIREDQTFTVGAGQDFTTLQAAFDYLGTLVIEGQENTGDYGGPEVPTVTLNLAAGTFTIDTDYSLRGYNGRLVIEGASAATTIITGTAYLYIQGLKYLYVDNVTWSLAFCTLREIEEQSFIGYNATTFSGNASIYADKGSNITLYPNGAVACDLGYLNAYSGGKLNLSLYNTGAVTVDALNAYGGEVDFSHDGNQASIDLYAVTTSVFGKLFGANTTLVTIGDSFGAQYAGSSISWVGDLTFSGANTTSRPAHLYADGGTVTIDGTVTFTDVNAAEIGVLADAGGAVRVSGGITMPTSPSGTPYSIPIESVMEDGSVIHTGDANTPIYIKETVEITVGTGKDFTNINDALDYARRMRPIDADQGIGGFNSSIPVVHVRVDAGTYTLSGNGLAGDNDYLYYDSPCRTFITGEGTLASDVVIQAAADNAQFEVTNCYGLVMADLTIDIDITIKNVKFVNFHGGFGGLYDDPIFTPSVMVGGINFYANGVHELRWGIDAASDLDQIDCYFVHDFSTYTATAEIGTNTNNFGHCGNVTIGSTAGTTTSNVTVYNCYGFSTSQTQTLTVNNMTLTDVRKVNMASILTATGQYTLDNCHGNFGYAAVTGTSLTIKGDSNIRPYNDAAFTLSGSLWVSQGSVFMAVDTNTTVDCHDLYATEGSHVVIGDADVSGTTTVTENSYLEALGTWDSIEILKVHDESRAIFRGVSTNDEKLDVRGHSKAIFMSTFVSSAMDCHQSKVTFVGAVTFAAQSPYTSVFTYITYGSEIVCQSTFTVTTPTGYGVSLSVGSKFHCEGNLSITNVPTSQYGFVAGSGSVAVLKGTISITLNGGTAKSPATFSQIQRDSTVIWDNSTQGTFA